MVSFLSIPPMSICQNIRNWLYLWRYFHLCMFILIYYIPLGHWVGGLRVSTLGLGGHGFDPQPRHTKDYKKGTHYFLAWHSASKVGHWQGVRSPNDSRVRHCCFNLYCTILYVLIKHNTNDIFWTKCAKVNSYSRSCCIGSMTLALKILIFR